MSQLLGKLKDIVSELDEEDIKELREKKNQKREEKKKDYHLQQPTKEELKTYKIDQEEAFLIASKDANLKTDYTRNSKYRITYLNFRSYQSGIVKKNNHTYWYIIITEADFSCAMHDEFGCLVLADGTIKDEEELKKLRCYVDTQTGKYYYHL